MATYLMNNMRLLKVLTTALLILIAPLTQAETKWLDKVVAIVDDDIILASELDERLDSIKANIARTGKQAPPEDELRKEVLDLLVLENIQMQMANRYGLRIDDEELNGAVARIAANNNMTLSQFQQALTSSGASYLAVREQISREMILQRVQMGNVNQRIQVTDQEIQNYLQSSEGKEVTSPEFHFSHILIPVSSDATDAERKQAETQAKSLSAQLRAGKNIDNARDDISISDLGWRKGTELPALFKGVAANMKDGDVSDPLQSASGFHIIKLLESRGVQQLVKQTRASHILLKPSAIRDEAQTIALAKELRQRALKGEDFRELAKEYSEDIGSAQEGGDLGWTTPGQLVPEFQKAMDETAPGEIHVPVASQFGWHVIKVVERRTKDVTNDMRKQIARNALHERKYADELDIWLRKIRSEAFVDIKI
ncbi:peptidylprolyl isomerase [Zhongshania sp. BJYM1]|uniref:peptidylprolyl isomerase n=1 Tax=Zhongshania aquatica TaxID=2965069 RepID=UPI0022B2DFE8|nr:peptidylprolyl isomerase [Marortus sp. BJYM1]